ncbi:MAG: selenium metabolism-associated LysR family transcriptional regulator [Pseudomonadota bacterium]
MAIETRHLQIFVAVYKTKSFTKAAELLYTSQPTVSEHMQNLEARLNCRLFDRLGRSILPTAAAQLLYPRAIAILEDLRRLEDDITSTGNSMSGELIIGASTIPGTYILPAVAASFKNDFPGISFEIRINDSAKIVEAVAENELFIGIVGAKIPAAKLLFRPFTEDELILAAAGSNPLPGEITMADLCKLPFIVRERGSGTRKSIESLLARQHSSLDQLTICATLGSSAAVKEAVKADLGVSVISRSAVRDELQNGTVREITVAGLTMKRNFYIVTSPKRTLPNQYQEFIKRLLDSYDFPRKL